MRTEYTVWGIPPGGEYEEPLYTKAETLDEAKRIVQILTAEYGCRECRISILDPTENPVDMFRKAVKM